MLYRKTNFLVGMILTAAMLLATGIAWGAATEVPVSGGQMTVLVLDPGTSWVDDDGITHVRDLILEVSFSGDIQGSAIQGLNYNIDPFGNGDLHGTACLWAVFSATKPCFQVASPATSAVACSRPTQLDTGPLEAPKRRAA